jgi:hypothetical protein
VDNSDLPLVVRLPKSKTGKGLVLPSRPAERIFSCLVGEPWVRVANLLRAWAPTQRPWEEGLSQETLGRSLLPNAFGTLAPNLSSQCFQPLLPGFSPPCSPLPKEGDWQSDYWPHSGLQALTMP